MISYFNDKSKQGNKFRYVFKLVTPNTNTKVIKHPLLRTHSLANERAMSEFLQFGYAEIAVTFTTWVSSFKLNDVVMLKGLKYKIVSITSNTNASSTMFNIKGVRYE